ncbi:TPA: ABC transporter ATPase [Clostridium perfringens]
MKELKTIQKREKLNKIFAVDKKGCGGANHEYHIVMLDKENKDAAQDIVEINFQKGARKEEKSQHGVIDTDLLEIVRDRLHCFQQGDFASEYNQQALIHVEEALMWLNRRVEDRIERNVLGENKK